MPLERKHFEALRKQSRTRAPAKLNATSGDGSSAPKLVREASPRTRTYEQEPKNPRILEAHHGLVSSSTFLPLLNLFPRSRRKVISTQPPSPIHSPLVRPVAAMPDNYYAARKIKNNILEQKSSEAQKNQVNVPTAKKKRRMIKSAQSSQEQNDQQREAISLVERDSDPLPFEFAKNSNPTAGPYCPLQTALTRQNAAPSSRVLVEKTLASTNIPVRQVLPEPFIPGEQPIVYSTVPSKQNIPTIRLPRKRQTLNHFKTPLQAENFIPNSLADSEKEWDTVPYSSVLKRHEEVITQTSVPIIRNHLRQRTLTQRTNHQNGDRSSDHSTIPTRQNPFVYKNRRSDETPEDVSIPSKYEESIANMISQLRQKQASAHSNTSINGKQTLYHSNIPSRKQPTLRRSSASVAQDRASTYSNDPATREQALGYGTVPPRPEPVSARSTTFSRRGQTIDYSNIPPRQERKLGYGTVPEKQKEAPVRSTGPSNRRRDSVYSSIPSRQEQISGSPIDSKTQEHVLTYSNIPTTQEQIFTTPTRQQQAYLYSNAPIKQEVLVGANHGQARSYENAPSRRSAVLRNAPRQHTKTELVIPVEQAVTHSNIPSRQIGIRRNSKYDRNIDPPTVSEQQSDSHSTLVLTTEIPKNSVYTRQRGQNRVGSDHQENDTRHKNDDYSEGGNSDGDGSNNSDDYSSSSNERIGKTVNAVPEDDSSAYHTKEESNDHTTYEYMPQDLHTYHVPGQKPLKIVVPNYDQDQVQHANALLKSQDSDYDQARGQNVQYEIADAQYPDELQENKKDLAEEANHVHGHHHEPKKEHESLEAGSKEQHQGEHEESGGAGEKV